ncbi:TetR/AcrR family transcriptional regulator [Rhodococcus sp. SJ-2]
MSIPARARRTQQQRRQETIGRILDSTIESLAELGYAATTIGEICSRSGLSSGGVFRHFPTRLDLMVAAADEVGIRQFANFRTGLEQLGGPDAGIESVRACLQLLRDATRAPINAAWYELLGAARTDARLREHLVPMGTRYHAAIAEFARALPIAERFGAAEFDMILFSLVHLFDGEALVATVHPQPEQEEPRIEFLAQLLVSVTLRIGSGNEQ